MANTVHWQGSCYGVQGNHLPPRHTWRHTSLLEQPQLYLYSKLMHSLLCPVIWCMDTLSQHANAKRFANNLRFWWFEGSWKMVKQSGVSFWRVGVFFSAANVCQQLSSKMDEQIIKPQQQPGIMLPCLSVPQRRKPKHKAWGSRQAIRLTRLASRSFFQLHTLSKAFCRHTIYSQSFRLFLQCLYIQHIQTEPQLYPSSVTVVWFIPTEVMFLFNCGIWNLKDGTVHCVHL